MVLEKNEINWVIESYLRISAVTSNELLDSRLTYLPNLLGQGQIWLSIYSFYAQNCNQIDFKTFGNSVIERKYV